MKFSVIALATPFFLVGILDVAPSAAAPYRPSVIDPQVVLPLSPAVNETTFFGGTVWNASTGGYEAIPGGTWTFESGVGSVIPVLPGPKPPGFHSLMEGWSGVDLSTRSTGSFRRSETCALVGNWSVWCGFTADEAATACFLAGQGYGNDWNGGLRKTFVYPGTGDVILSFRYAGEAEPGYDFFGVTVDPDAEGAAPPLDLLYGTGVDNHGGQPITYLLTAMAGQLPPGGGPFTLTFWASSDAAYSDEDGLFDTACGIFAVDDVNLFGAVSDFSDFESGLNGWGPTGSTDPIGGDWTNLMALASLPPPVIPCATGLGDSVLTLFDPSIPGHGRYQYNVAISPWIDLAAAGVADWPGKFIEHQGYFNINAPYLPVVYGFDYEPEDCAPAGLQTINDVTLHPDLRIFANPLCFYGASSMRVDISPYIPAGATRLRIAVGVDNQTLSGGAGPISYDTSPWFDNIRLGVYRQAVSGVGDEDVARGPETGRIHPNPVLSGSRAVLSMELPVAGNVDISLFDLAGRRLRSLHAGPVEAGPFELSWDTRDSAGRLVPSGIYFWRIETPRGVFSQKVVVQGR